MNLIKLLLIPLQITYYLITRCRNILYDYSFIKAHQFHPIIISIGNLKLGGTGKTPLVEYIIKLMHERKIAVLSRGYKRKSKGFLVVNKTHSAEAVGDENRQLKHKFPNTLITCDTNRVKGVKNILTHNTKTELIVLDDGYQHRQLHRDLDIVLTEYNALYINDQILPIGKLRESKKEIQRAHIIIITKCPKNISKTAKEEVIKSITLEPHQKIYFCYISNYDFIDMANNTPFTLDKKDKYVLTTGIANSKPLISFLNAEKINIKHIKFADHYYFTNNDILNIINIKKMGQYSDFLLLTEKDFYRLSGDQIKNLENHFKLICIQIKIDFIRSDKYNFNNQLLNFKKSKK